MRAWAKSTTCHGVADFSDQTHIIGRSVWFSVLFFVFLLLGLNLYIVIGDFGTQWTTTTSEVSSPEGLDFPIITLCNYNRLRQSQIDKYNVSKATQSLLFENTPTAYILGANTDNTDEAVQNFSRWRIANNFTSLHQIYQTLGHQYIDSIYHIQVGRYNAKNARSVAEWENNVINSTGYLITNVLNSEFGNCFQININITDSNGVRMKTKIAGKLQGLLMILNAQVDEYSTELENSYWDSGFVMQLSYDGQVAVGNWLSISPGDHLHVGIQRATTTLQKTFRTVASPPCALNPPLTVYPGQPYTQNLCLKECFQVLVTKYCGCVWLDTAATYRTCGLEEFLSCANNNPEADLLNFVKPTCNDQCLDACEKNEVLATVSASRFPAESKVPQMIQFLQDFRNVSLDQLHNSFASIDVYYSQLTISHTERYERTLIDQLISNIGAQMGLWTGASVVTILQAIIYLLANCCRKQQTRTVHVQNVDHREHSAARKHSN